MPTFALQVRATLENVEQFHAPQTMKWSIKFTCLNCKEVGKTFMTFASGDSHLTARGAVNLISRCQFCNRCRTVDVIKKSEQPYKNADQPAYKTIVKFECRGMEPIAFSPQDGWEVEATNSKVVFSNVDLKDSEWVEYDVKQQCPVGLYSLEYQFVKE